MKKINFLAIAVLMSMTNIATSCAATSVWSYFPNRSSFNPIDPKAVDAVKETAKEAKTGIPKFVDATKQFGQDVKQNLQRFNENATLVKDNVTAFTTNLDQKLDKVTADMNGLGKKVDHKLETVTKDISKATRKFEDTTDEVKWFTRLGSILIGLVIFKYFLVPAIQSFSAYIKQIKDRRKKKRYSISMDEKFL